MRIVWEPVFLLLLSVILQDLFIIQSWLALYLKFAALALFMKSFIAWFRNYEFSRDVLDIAIAGPAMAKFVDNRATEEDLAPFHIASFPATLDPEIRLAAAKQIARTYSPEK